MKTLTRKQINERDAAVQRAISGMLIPMMALPELCNELDEAWNEGKRDNDLRNVATDWLAGVCR